MEKMINIIFSIGNTFWKPYVTYLIYGMFYNEVGFELPELSYLNILAFMVILGFFINNTDVLLTLDDKEDKDDRNKYRAVVAAIIYGLALFFGWLLHLILF